jgi:hypothetical protein
LNDVHILSGANLESSNKSATISEVITYIFYTNEEISQAKGGGGEAGRGDTGIPLDPPLNIIALQLAEEYHL